MSKNPACPKCRCDDVVKNGKVKEKQRFICKNCRYQFTRLTPRGRSPKEKAMAVILYTLGLSFNVIGKFIGVSTTTIYYWVKNFAISKYEKPAPGDAIIVEIDEMWHYLKKRKINYGYGKLIVEKLENLSIGNVVVVTNKLCQD